MPRDNNIQLTKELLIRALVICIIFVPLSVNAVSIEDVMRDKSTTTPTLDALKQAGLDVPSSYFKYTAAGSGFGVTGTNYEVDNDYNLTTKTFGLELKESYDNFKGPTNAGNTSAQVSILGTDVTFTYVFDKIYENIGNYSGVYNNRTVSLGLGQNVNLIQADFINVGSGPAIATRGSIGSIIGTFISNTRGGDAGAAISNWDYGKIGSIKGVFINNYTTNIGGGAIENNGKRTAASPDSAPSTIGTISGIFIGNHTDLYGGAIFNHDGGVIDNIYADFIGNYAYSGGAIMNRDNSVIGNIYGDFIGNYINSNNVVHGGAIQNYKSTINYIVGDFISNRSNSDGGAITNLGGNGTGSVIENIIGNFVLNSAGTGGAISNEDNSTITSINGTFIKNNVFGNPLLGNSAAGGAILNNKSGIIDSINGVFIENYGTEESMGGAICNYNSTINDVSGAFVNNHASQGGAIWTNTDLTVSANGDGVETLFRGNYDDNGSSAIWVDGKDRSSYTGVTYLPSGTIKSALPTITLNAQNGGTISLYDVIDGDFYEDTLNEENNHGYGLAMQGDSKINIYNDIKNAEMSHSGSVTTDVYNPDYLNNNNSLTMNSGTVNLLNFEYNNLKFRDLTLNGGTINIEDIKVDLVNKNMGSIEAVTSGAQNKVINVKSFDLINDGVEDITSVYFANDVIANGVYTDVGTVDGPIYRYLVEYSTDARKTMGGVGNGHFLFIKNGFVPPIYSAPVAQLTGGYASMVKIFDYAFEHADTFSALPLSTRKAMMDENKYAYINAFFPSYVNELNTKALWIRPYTSFENIPLKNGPNVNTILYGTLIGGDSELKYLKNEWTTAFTTYIAYNGANQTFATNHTNQNGGAIGLTQTFYHNNLCSAITVSVGASAGETSTAYGYEYFSMLMAGVASRTGYNFEFRDGEYIIQPLIFVAYTFINPFDYTNARGVDVDSDTLNVIQVYPHIKFVRNTESGWQPYISAGFVYNVMGETRVRANDLILPSLSIKPYAVYGVGVQKFRDDNFVGYAQAMIHNGGRNGLALAFGLRWAVGKTKTNPNTKTASMPKIIKSL